MPALRSFSVEGVDSWEIHISSSTDESCSLWKWCVAPTELI